MSETETLALSDIWFTFKQIGKTSFIQKHLVILLLKKNFCSPSVPIYDLIRNKGRYFTIKFSCLAFSRKPNTQAPIILTYLTSVYWVTTMWKQNRCWGLSEGKKKCKTRYCAFQVICTLVQRQTFIHRQQRGMT